MARQPGECWKADREQDQRRGEIGGVQEMLAGNAQEHGANNPHSKAVEKEACVHNRNLNSYSYKPKRKATPGPPQSLAWGCGSRNRPRLFSLLRRAERPSAARGAVQ